MQQRMIERNTHAADHVVRIVVHRPSIETGIPFTPRSRPQNWEYPYEQMNIGDSFHILHSETEYQRVASRVSVYNKSHPDTKFSIRTQTNTDGEKLTRIWRIE